MIRPATIHDVPRIQEIINSHAELGKMLFKSYAQLYEDLRDFAVYEEDGTGRSAASALTIIWADLAEVRSLAVDERYRGRGIGRRLVEWMRRRGPPAADPQAHAPHLRAAVLREARLRGGGKDTLPLKVWSDCVRCPKRDGCDEIAMVRVLQDVPIVEHRRPPRRRRGG